MVWHQEEEPPEHLAFFGGGVAVLYGLQDLNSMTRDRTQGPGSESAES